MTAASSEGEWSDDFATRWFRFECHLFEGVVRENQVTSSWGPWGLREVISSSSGKGSPWFHRSWVLVWVILWVTLCKLGCYVSQIPETLIKILIYISMCVCVGGGCLLWHIAWTPMKLQFPRTSFMVTVSFPQGTRDILESCHDAVDAHGGRALEYLVRRYPHFTEPIKWKGCIEASFSFWRLPVWTLKFTWLPHPLGSNGVYR